MGKPMTLKELDNEIVRLEGILANIDPISNTELYGKLVSNLEILYKAKALHESGKSMISKDILINAGITVFGILSIIFAEDSKILSSKAFSFLGRVRV